jgi:hypothetical protein
MQLISLCLYFEPTRCFLTHDSLHCEIVVVAWCHRMTYFSDELAGPAHLRQAGRRLSISFSCFSPWELPTYLQVTMLPLVTVQIVMHRHSHLMAPQVKFNLHRSLHNWQHLDHKGHANASDTTSDPGWGSTYISPFTITTTTRRRLYLFSHFRFDDSASPINYAERCLLLLEHTRALRT